MTLEAIQFTGPENSSPASLRILDQLQLPHTTAWVVIKTSKDAFDSIRSMQVRGAPAIALVAALSLVVEDPLDATSDDSVDFKLDAAFVSNWYNVRLNHLMTSRPTAVNLGDAVAKLKQVVLTASESSTADAASVRDAYVAAAIKMLEDDVQDNKAIGLAGAEWISRRIEANGLKDDKCAVVTHCNTGSLATAGYGTALGIVRSLHSAGKLKRVFYTETRPYNQGSRLTGYELLHDSIPATMITDSMAASLFHTRRSDENIVAVIVGADRVAANGDTANKIGTYGLAVLARQHGIAFIVAAPRTTIDMQTASGNDITIEERPQEEVMVAKGPRVLRYTNGKQDVQEGHTEVVSTAAIGTVAWNPAFDVTPAYLIDAIVTELGVAEKPDGKFDLARLFTTESAANASKTAAKDMPSPSEGP